MTRQNHKNDLRVTLTLTAGGESVGLPEWDFDVQFLTIPSCKRFVCTRRGDQYTACEPNEDGTLVCFLENHGLSPGRLCVELTEYIPDTDFADGTRKRVSVTALDVYLTESDSDDAAAIAAECGVDVQAILDLISHNVDTYTKEEVDAMLSGKMEPLVVQTLPPVITARRNVLYFVPKSSSDTSDLYDEYMVIVDGDVAGWEKIGSGGSSDLSDYYTKSQTDALVGAKYTKPSGGIPATDLAAAVQTSLGKAETALQSFTETDPTVPAWAKAESKPSYSYSEISGTPSLAAVATSGDYNDLTNKPTIPDVSGKADKRVLVDNSSASGAVTLDATKYHDFGTTDSVDVELPSGAARTDEFLFTFTCNAGGTTSLLLPDGVEMGNGLVFEAAAGRRVQVSIMDGIALLAYVDPSNNE